MKKYLKNKNSTANKIFKQRCVNYIIEVHQNHKLCWTRDANLSMKAIILKQPFLSFVIMISLKSKASKNK